jgi:hypothetical protein
MGILLVYDVTDEKSFNSQSAVKFAQIVPSHFPSFLAHRRAV